MAQQPAGQVPTPDAAFSAQNFTRSSGKNVHASGQRLGHPNEASLAQGEDSSQTPKVGTAPNPQLLLMNTLGRGPCNSSSAPDHISLDPKPSSIPAAKPPAVPVSNPFVPHIQPAKPSGFSAALAMAAVEVPDPQVQPFRQQSAADVFAFSGFSKATQNPPPKVPQITVPEMAKSSTDLMHVPIPETPKAKISTDFAFKSQPETAAQPGSQRTDKFGSPSTNSLTLSPGEKGRVCFVLESMAVCNQKLDFLIGIATKFGISLDPFKRFVNLKTILARQLELQRSDVFLLNPSMAENLAEHLRNFTHLLLRQINQHPSANSVLASMRSSPIFSNSSTSTSTPTPTPLSSEPTTTTTPSTRNTEPSRSKRTKEAPLAARQQKPNAGQARPPPASIAAKFLKSDLIKVAAAPSDYHNSAPSLFFIRDTAKKGDNVAISYFRSQVDFLRTRRTAGPADSLSALDTAIQGLRPALERLLEK